MKNHKFASSIVAILILATTTGIAYAYAPGSSACFLTNPPNRSVTWNFFGRHTIDVTLTI